MKTIAIFQSDLNVGGIQKSLLNLLNAFDYTRYNVDLYLFDDKEFFETKMPKEVHVFHLKTFPYFFRFIHFGLIRKFYHPFCFDKNYDVAIDFNSYWNECALGALTINAKKRVMWIHNDVEIKRKEEVKYRLLYHFFKSKLKYFDVFAAVSAGIVEPFRKVTHVNKPIEVIPNIVNTAEIFAKSQELIDFEVDDNKYNIVTVGRLCHQKGIDILLQEYAEAKKRREDMHLYIIGDGPDRLKIEKQIEKLHLSDDVSLLGNQSNPFPYLRKMDAFVLDSRYEGQGIVLLEAKALGLELIFPTRLEKYNEGLIGSESIVDVLCKVQKSVKIVDDLQFYNTDILKKLDLLLN